MWLLFGTTLTASFFDSLNPSAIAQQMLLQAIWQQNARFRCSQLQRPARLAFRQIT